MVGSSSRQVEVAVEVVGCGRLYLSRLVCLKTNTSAGGGVGSSVGCGTLYSCLDGPAMEDIDIRLGRALSGGACDHEVS